MSLNKNGNDKLSGVKAFASKIFDALSSLELAIVVILLIALVSAIGTFVEAKHGTEIASLLVYRSWTFTSILVLFALNLAFAAFSRWPWRRHHIGFLVTHLGLIILLVGGWITREFGVDGTIALGPEESASVVRVPKNYFNVFISRGGSNYERLLSQHLEFNPLREFRGQQSWNLSLAKAGKVDQFIRVELLDWWPYALRKVGVRLNTEQGAGVPAVHFRLLSSRANLNEWLFLNGIQGSTLDMGPARVRFQQSKPASASAYDKKTLIIYIESSEDKAPKVALVDGPDKPLRFLGTAELNKPLALGWMDFSLVIDEFYQKASPYTEYERAKKRNDTVEVIKVAIGGDERWVELGAAVQVMKGDDVYYAQFAMMEVPLGFSIGLQDFQVHFYEGSRQAKSYESRVNVTHPSFALKDITIKMNEPLHHGGFTFYQSSYSTDNEGKPVISVLSVNYDPGKWINYLGCTMLVLGILLMFYFKPIYSGRNKLIRKTIGSMKEGLKS